MQNPLVDETLRRALAGESMTKALVHFPVIPTNHAIRAFLVRFVTTSRHDALVCVYAGLVKVYRDWIQTLSSLNPEFLRESWKTSPRAWIFEDLGRLARSETFCEACIHEGLVSVLVDALARHPETLRHSTLIALNHILDGNPSPLYRVRLASDVTDLIGKWIPMCLQDRLDVQGMMLATSLVCRLSTFWTSMPTTPDPTTNVVVVCQSFRSHLRVVWDLPIDELDRHQVVDEPIRTQMCKVGIIPLLIDAMSPTTHTAHQDDAFFEYCNVAAGTLTNLCIGCDEAKTQALECGIVESLLAGTIDRFHGPSHCFVQLLRVLAPFAKAWDLSTLRKILHGDPDLDSRVRCTIEEIVRQWSCRDESISQ
jgi:hypothetical protein